MRYRETIIQLIIIVIALGISLVISPVVLARQPLRLPMPRTTEPPIHLPAPAERMAWKSVPQIARLSFQSGNNPPTIQLVAHHIVKKHSSPIISTELADTLKTNVKMIASEQPDITRARPAQVQTIQIPITQVPVQSGKPNQSEMISKADTSVAAADNPRFSLNSQLGLGAKSRIHINGFLSAGGAQATVRNRNTRYVIPGHSAISNDWNFAANSLVGLQVTGNITKNLSAVVQLVADGEDTNGNKPYRVNVDWAFLRYSLNHTMQTRTGRLRLPAFLYSETQQVGYSYPWVFLPNEVYRIVPFENMTGGDFIYTLSLGQTGWSVQLEPYYGGNTSDFDLYTRGTVPVSIFNLPIPQGKTAIFQEDNILGFVAAVSNPFVTLRGTYFRTRLTGFIPHFVIPIIGSSTRVTLFSNKLISFYSIGGKLNYQHFLILAELAHRSTSAQLASLTGYYLLFGYHLGQILPNFTFANISTGNTDALLKQQFSELVQAQRSYTLGLVYYLNSNLDTKLSISLIQPRKGNGLFTNNPGRKNVLLYGVAVDAIF